MSLCYSRISFKRFDFPIAVLRRLTKKPEHHACQQFKPIFLRPEKKPASHAEKLALSDSPIQHYSLLDMGYERGFKYLRPSDGQDPSP